VGYLHAQEDIISQVEKAHIPLSICAPVISQYAALGALRGPQDCVEEFRSKYERSRDLMCERLDGLSDYFDYCKPEGAYLMFPKVLIDGWKDDSGGFSKELLLKAKVSATPGVAFGPTGEGHIRLSFCLPEDMVNKAFDRIGRFCAEI
jgi:aminotransferase